MAVITEQQVTDFGKWLRKRGRAEGTVALYRKNLNQCRKDPDGLTGRLLSPTLAPKTKRTNLATLAAWAKYTKDAELAEEISEIKLPPATRVTPKFPLAPDVWAKYIETVQRSRMNAPTRATILIMAQRGLRVSDVLRITRRAALESLRSGKLAYEGKGGKRIEISVVPIREALEILTALPDWDRVEDLFGVDRETAANRVRRAVARCGAALRIEGTHPHQLRRTYALAFLKEHDGDPQAIMKLVAHMHWSGVQVAAGYVDSVNLGELDAIGAKMMERVQR